MEEDFKNGCIVMDQRTKLNPKGINNYFLFFPGTACLVLTAH